MSFLDQLESHRMPTADDVEISLPPRREPKKPQEPASDDARELGQHGGAAGGGTAAAGGRADVATAPEPAPQRDDPDDGEHTDSTEQQVAARARKVDDEEPQPVEEPGETDVEPEYGAVLEDADEAPAHVEDERSFKEVLASTTGSHPLTFKWMGFSAGDDTPTTVLKRFPQPIVDKLKLLLAASTGGEFAETISSPALVTAFLVATLGVELDLDENTAAAADVFRRSDARMSSVEDKVEQVLENVDQLAHAMKLSLKRIADTGDIADTLEFSMAYLIADRVATLTSHDVNETNVDVAQKKVLQARERIRKTAKEQRTIEKQRDGRRMA